jgi:hypothetical protein
MRFIMVILCASILSACGVSGGYSANNEWTNMDYAAVSGQGAGGDYLSISPGMGMK